MVAYRTVCNKLKRCLNEVPFWDTLSESKIISLFIKTTLQIHAPNDVHVPFKWKNCLWHFFKTGKCSHIMNEKFHRISQFAGAYILRWKNRGYKRLQKVWAFCLKCARLFVAFSCHCLKVFYYYYQVFSFHGCPFLLFHKSHLKNNWLSDQETLPGLEDPLSGSTQ